MRELQRIYEIAVELSRPAFCMLRRGHGSWCARGKSADPSPVVGMLQASIFRARIPRVRVRAWSVGGGRSSLRHGSGADSVLPADRTRLLTRNSESSIVARLVPLEPLL